MNKQEYLSALREYLAPMPSQDREELLQDYETHFDFGTENGRSEEDTARMLGEPLALAKEILEQGYLPAQPVQQPPKRDIARMIGVTIALLFLNMAALPILASLWAVFASICAVAVAGCLSLVLLLIEHLLYGGITPAKSFVAAGSTGVGMLAAFFVRYYGVRWMLLLTVGYWKWTARTWLGRK
ncbi:DUF1700 domain-containing protein [Cohnella yongneupensis]|uniref:DUF1700 domain-containing protein n=1 Tax=Cohnella yongneupensis TaxID=425006 RepID=A0ABW0R4C7_9BACL